MACCSRTADLNMTKPIVRTVKLGVRKSERKCIVKISVKLRAEKCLVEKLVQKWRPRDNVCLLFALWGMMTVEQRMLVTLNGKEQFLHVVQDSLGLVRRDSFKNGLASSDIVLFLNYFVKLYAEQGRVVNYTWKRLRELRGRNRRWTMKSLEGGVISRSGCYVMFGRAKRSNAVYVNTLKRLKKTDTLSAAIEEYVGNGKITGADHAMGVCVGDDLSVKMYDNSWRVDHKTFSVVNFLSSLSNVAYCFCFELSETIV